MVSHMLILFHVVPTLSNASSVWNTRPLLTHRLSVNRLLVTHWLTVDSSGTLLPAVFPVSSHHIASVTLAHRVGVALLCLSRISLEAGTKEALNTSQE